MGHANPFLTTLVDQEGTCADGVSKLRHDVTTSRHHDVTTYGIPTSGTVQGCGFLNNRVMGACDLTVFPATQVNVALAVSMFI